MRKTSEPVLLHVHHSPEKTSSLPGPSYTWLPSDLNKQEIFLLQNSYAAVRIQPLPRQFAFPEHL